MQESMNLQLIVEFHVQPWAQLCIGSRWCCRSTRWKGGSLFGVEPQACRTNVTSSPSCRTGILYDTHRDSYCL